MARLYLVLIVMLVFPTLPFSQTIQDDFEGSGTITNWFGDDCFINTSSANPFQQGINNSATVLEYDDQGGLYANVRFQIDNNFDLSSNNVFSLKLYVLSDSLTGNQPNQVSLKLQDGTLSEPWSTQTEIIKPISLNEWQTITFDFENDNYINLDNNSLPPAQRTDLNRVVIQINGENNEDQVVAYLDDFFYNGTVVNDPVYNYLVWSDEFDGSGAIDDSKWFHQTQLPNGWSWYNNEIQHYTDREDNSFVDNGILSIVARKETFTDQGYTKEYTSARLNSKFAFQYGRVEIRAKLPTGGGTWPALWMLGKNINENGGYWDIEGFGTTGWPACGEIDIMEHWGNNQNYVQSATHTPSSYGATINHGGQTITTASSEFHIYTLIWTPEKLIFSVDGNIHYVYNPDIKDATTWPFDAEQYFLFNIAIQPSIDPAFTQSAMEVDYIRVYQEAPVSVNLINTETDLIYYPNPVGNELTIEFGKAPEQDVDFKIYNMNGRLIKTYTRPVFDNNFTLDSLGQLQQGAYLLLYEIKNKRNSLKFIKN